MYFYYDDMDYIVGDDVLLTRVLFGCGVIERYWIEWDGDEDWDGESDMGRIFFIRRVKHLDIELY